MLAEIKKKFLNWIKLLIFLYLIRNLPANVAKYWFKTPPAAIFATIFLLASNFVFSYSSDTTLMNVLISSRKLLFVKMLQNKPLWVWDKMLSSVSPNFRLVYLFTIDYLVNEDW